MHQKQPPAKMARAVMGLGDSMAFAPPCHISIIDIKAITLYIGNRAMNKNPVIPDTIDRYLRDIITRETPTQRRLREETSRLPMSVMQTTPDQVAFLAMLVRMLNAKRILEV